MWADLDHSLPIGFKFGANAAQDYLVLDFILGREERGCMRDGFDLRLPGDESQALYPTYHRAKSLVRVIRPSDGSVPTLFAVKSLIVKPSYLTQPALDYNHLLRSIRVLNLIWHGTKLPRQRSSMFYQDFLHPHRGKQHIVELFDTFVNVPVPTIEIPRHCALLELLGPSLSEMRTARQLEVGVVKEATRQVLLALDFLRTQCGMLYLGLDTATVLIKFATEQEAFDFYLQKDFSALDLSSIHVKLTGFNRAELIDNGPLPDYNWGPMRESQTHRVSAAPEIDPVEYHPNFRYLCQLDPEGLSADFWSLGFFVWELLTGETDLFHPDSEPPPYGCMNKPETLRAYGIRRCLKFLKFVTERSYPPPPRDYQVDHPEYVQHIPHPEIVFNFPDALRTDQGWSMRERLVAHDVLPDGDVDQVVAVLRGCFQADPSRRLTARQLLETEWLREETKA